MRLARHVVVCLALVWPIAVIAGDPQGQELASAGASDSRRLPVKRVVLYKNGIGFFEHLGQVTGTESLAIDFTSAQLDDVLKSLTVLDLDGGTVTAVGYNSDAPLVRRLGALHLPVDAEATSSEFLAALRGARVAVTRAGSTATGRLLAVERRREGDGDRARDVDRISVVTEAGDVRLFDLGPDTTVRLLERELNERVGRYLGLVASSRDRDARRMTMDATGSGSRRVYVSYVSEVPVWKTTYRLVLPSDTGTKGLLQGWAIVDNTVGEDWEDVELSLVAGAPVSFIQKLSQPFYTLRPVVPPPSSVLLAPQTHEGTLIAGRASVAGRVADEAGAALPGVTVRLVDRAGRTVASAISDSTGAYRLESASAGEFIVRAELAGFLPASMSVPVGAGQTATVDLALQVGAPREALTVQAAPPPPPAPRRVGGALGGKVAGVPEARLELADRIASQPVAAAARDLGDLFEYKLERPVTIRQNQSALVPILQAEIGAERVSLWPLDRASGARPLRAVWLTNTSALTLDAGSFALLDRNTFAGEGLTDTIKPGERRLLSYAVDLAVRIDDRQAPQAYRVSRVRAVNGLLISDREQCAEHTYTIRNEDAQPRTLVIEHPVRPGWTLVPGTAGAIESSGSAYRFSVPVDAKKNASLVVREAHVEEIRYAASDLGDDQVALMLKTAQLGPQQSEALRTLAARKGEILALDQELGQRSAEAERIAADQGRLRENMKALKGSAEEKRLLERYVRQLDQQEDQLAAARSAVMELQARRDKLQADLSEQVQRLAFDTGEGVGSACASR